LAKDRRLARVALGLLPDLLGGPGRHAPPGAPPRTSRPALRPARLFARIEAPRARGDRARLWGLASSLHRPAHGRGAAGGGALGATRPGSRARRGRNPS
jgi:hypothetical protein